MLTSGQIYVLYIREDKVTIDLEDSHGYTQTLIKNEEHVLFLKEEWLGPVGARYHKVLYKDTVGWIYCNDCVLGEIEC